MPLDNTPPPLAYNCEKVKGEFQINKAMKILCAVITVTVLASGAFGMTKAQDEACSDIIHGAALEAAGSAAVTAQMPGVDNIAFVVLVGKMIIQLAGVFDISLSAGNVAATAYTVGVSFLSGGFAIALTARTASQWLVGWIPFVGNAINAASMAGLVEYIGWHVAYQFEAGDFSMLEMEFERK